MTHLPKLILCILLGAIAPGCGASEGSSYDPALEGLSVSAVQPGLLLPQSRLVIKGRSFVGQPWGAPTFVLHGDFDNGSESYEVNVSVPATFIDLETLEVQIDSAFLDLLGSSQGAFDGHVRIDIDSSIDNKRHSSAELPAQLVFRENLTPVLTSLYDSGPLFVNDDIEVVAEGLLLGGEEGTSFARVEGCFQVEGETTCDPVAAMNIPLIPESVFARDRASFAFVPQIAGITPGQFRGNITIHNEHGAGTLLTSTSSEATYELSKPAIFSVGPSAVSLGQYLDVSGGGFVKTEGGSATLLELTGQFEPEGGSSLALDVILVPDFASGRSLRYTVNEDDTLGQGFDLRYARGQFSGQLVATVSYGGDTVSADPVPFSVNLAPVRQVVYLKFTDQYLDALRLFGLRAMDSVIRARVAAVVQRDFRTVNVEVRLEEPDDYSLYSVVEIGGSDPNGLGLLGYDNTPGKDTGNERLHDTIGGVNATTQQDGYPGYGGVFIESLFVFSEHPGSFAPDSPVGEETFDAIFDAFRPDQKGEPVRAADLSAGASLPTNGQNCPATDRTQQIGCATWVLSNLVGSTISHEIGHSLGLANPEGGDFHHLSDAPNRIMDSGSSRSFDERAELNGAGPGHFCDDAYEYLRLILPTQEAEDMQGRPTCF
jgi:hypothetical protein